MPMAVLLGENSLFKTIGEIFHPLFVAIAAVLAWIYGIVPTYAVAIILLTVVIMVLLTPLTIKSTRSMIEMQALQPEMQKLRAKYKGAENRQQLNEEMMKLYKEHGVSPTGGCLPMFLQMPALIVLYDVIEGLANTVKAGATFGTGHKVCHPAVGQTLCATPRYVPHSSLIYHNLKMTPGVMKSIGLNLAAKPLTHRANIVDYIPYFILLLIAVGLQYFQMAQMTKRNKKSPTQKPAGPQQMQTMQKVMPLIFAYIYFLVPAGVVIYMIVSSGIRLITQDMIFRSGMVSQGAGGREVGKRSKPAATGGGAAEAIPAKSTSRPRSPDRSQQAEDGSAAAEEAQKKTQGKPTPGKPPQRKPAQGKPPPGKPQGQASGKGRRPPAGGKKAEAPAEPPPPAPGILRGLRARATGGGQPETANGTTKGSTNGKPAPKPHPRSKSKRARKAR